MGVRTAYFRRRSPASGERTGSSRRAGSGGRGPCVAPRRAMSGRTQEPPTFEDVAVYLSRAEWELVAEEQRELYRGVMRDNFALLASLGYVGPKPDLLYRLEHGEEPWVCTPQGPSSWDAPDSPSTGCNGDRTWPEEPFFTRWPNAGGHGALEESAQTHGERCACPSAGLCGTGGPCEPWQLRCTRLLKKFADPKGEAQAEAAGSRAPPAGSPEQAQASSRSGEEEAEDERGARPGGGTGLPLQPVPQHGAADPRERLGAERRETSQATQRAAEDGSLPPAREERGGDDEDGAVLGDHCYSTRQEAAPQHGAPFWHALREHDYCGDGKSGASALRDHDYCQEQTLPRQGIVCENTCPACRARAKLRQLRKGEVRQSCANGRGRREKRRLRLFFRSLQLSRGYFCADCLFQPAGPPSARPAKAEGSRKDACGVLRPSVGWETTIPRPREKGSSRGCTAEAPRVRAASPKPLAGEARDGAVRPEVWVRYRVRGRRPPRPWWDLARRELVAPSQASLCNACDGDMRTRNWALCDTCLSSATCWLWRRRPRSAPAEHRGPLSRIRSTTGSPPAGLCRRSSEGSGA